MTPALGRRHFLHASLALPIVAGCREAPTPPALRPPRERAVLRVLASVATLEGAGVHLRRSLGGRALSHLDPFLLLDEIRSNDPAEFMPGFPTHPHRGFETVTYVLDGAMEHRDSLGNRGRLGPGSAQWMTAGRGILHSEMPQREGSSMWGFQLWVNLPAKDKLRTPRYQDIPRDRIAEGVVRGASVRVVAGTYEGLQGPVDGVGIEPRFLDVKLASGERFEFPVPRSHASFVYVLDGDAEVGPQKTHVPRGSLAALGEGDVALVRAGTASRFLVVSGEPLREPIARRGPFVMNTEEELDRAWADFRAGRLVGG